MGGEKKTKQAQEASPPALHAKVEVQNNTWKSMRFFLTLQVDEPVQTILRQLEARYSVQADDGLRLFLGDCEDDERLIPLDSTIKGIGLEGGSRTFDDRVQRITFVYPKFDSILNVPIRTILDA